MRAALRRAGYELVRPGADDGLPPDFDSEAAELCGRVAPFTMTGPERIVALRDAVRHVVRAGVPGAIAECGVWRGGSMQVVALTLMDEGVGDRELYLFDTFDHMPAPSDRDVDRQGRRIVDHESYLPSGRPPPESEFAYIPFEEVRAALYATGYPPERFHFVVGRVEDTVPAAAPDRIALLRLDTDWYESTRHEMRELFPRVAKGGVVLIDDYGHFRGCRQAVDEYLAEEGLHLYLHRIDYTGRLIVVP